MRGKDKVNLKFSDPAWITPAYAGKREDDETSTSQS